MSGLFRDACADLSGRAIRLSSLSSLPREARTQVAARDIGASGLSVDARNSVTSLNVRAERLLSTMRTGGTLSTKDIRDAIWCLWETTPSLASDPSTLEMVIRDTERSDKRKLFRALSTVYLLQFRPDRPGLARISGALQRGALKWGEPYSGYQSNYSLYDPDMGPKKIAAMALARDLSPADAMTSLGLSALDARSSFTEAITRSLLTDLGNGAEPDDMKRLRKVQSYAFDDRHELLFRGMDQEIAEALVKPFLAKTPEKAIKDLFLNFIVSIFKDPRTYPARWERFPQIKAMVISWLTEQSLRQFLDIVAQTIKDPSDFQMWRYRRAFWEAAHRKGIIKGAWVIFAEDGARLARKSFGQNAGFGSFNKLGSKQIQRSHAVLLLEVGQGIVADWSHSGKVNIWADASEASAPRLYRAIYSSADVTISKDDMETDRYLVKTHSAPSSYSWQRVVANRIYRMTNTRLYEHDYK